MVPNNRKEVVSTLIRITDLHDFGDTLKNRVPLAKFCRILDISTNVLRTLVLFSSIQTE